MASDLLERKRTHFVLWRPRNTDPPPKLAIGRFRHGNPPAFVDQRELELRPSAAAPDLWEIAATDCDLTDGQVYHYWFAVEDSNPSKPSHPVIRCTDPTAWSVDWRLKALLPDPADYPGFGEDDRDPAGVVMFKDGRLVPCDPGGETPDWAGDARLRELPPNNRLVIYELPTAWIRPEELEGGAQVGVGTFRDARALVERRRRADRVRRRPGPRERGVPTSRTSASTRSSCCRRPTASSIASGATPPATTSPPTSTSASRAGTSGRPRRPTSPPSSGPATDTASASSPTW